jgi:hypothetical protein
VVRLKRLRLIEGRGGTTGGKWEPYLRGSTISTTWGFSPILLVYSINQIVDFLLHQTGVLACLDGYMNIAMEQTEEYVDGQLKSKYGDCFIRGNNGM